MSDKLIQLIESINTFREERDWRQFHNAKDLALSISLEAAELLEIFQWRSATEATATRREDLAEELADVLIYCFMLADDLGFDIEEIIRAKIAKNHEKYPVSKARGSNQKYTNLD